MKKRKNAKEIVLSMPFFAIMFYMMVIGFIIPLRPTQSFSEKRYLDKFPTFSFSSFISGEYTDKISHWFADTFPGREGWIQIDKTLNAFHGNNYNYIDLANLDENEEIPEIKAPDSSAQPDTGPSETVPPEETPAPTPVPFYMSPQATEFDIDPDQVDIEIYQGTIQIGDTIYSSLGFSKAASDSYASSLNSFAERCAREGIRVFNVTAPTSIGILLPDSLREELNCADQQKTLEYIASLYTDDVHAADTFSEINAHDSEYIYYHTDHHWTGLGAYYGYLAFCKSAGIPPVSLDKYEALDEGQFLGSYTATAIASGKAKTDNVTAYSPPGNVHMQIMGYSGQFEDAPVILDETEGSIYHKYNTYIGGDNMLSVIINDDLEDAPDCLVIKDSFGNPFSIYLSQHYHKAYIADYRKITMSALEYAKLYDVDDVIICQSIGVSQSTNANSLLGYVLR